jgi:hypothetical protein
MPELNLLAKTIWLTSDLAKLTLERIESKFAIRQVSDGRSTRNWCPNGCAFERDMTRKSVPKGRSRNLVRQKMQALQVYVVSNDEGVTHYLYSVAGKTRAQEWILDSEASTHMTRDEKLISDWKPHRSTVRSWTTQEYHLRSKVDRERFEPGNTQTQVHHGV